MQGTLAPHWLRLPTLPAILLHTIGKRQIIPYSNLSFSYKNYFVSVNLDKGMLSKLYRYLVTANAVYGPDSVFPAGSVVLDFYFFLSHICLINEFYIMMLFVFHESDISPFTRHLNVLTFRFGISFSQTCSATLLPKFQLMIIGHGVGIRR